jgi:hypothetical protein
MVAEGLGEHMADGMRKTSTKVARKAAVRRATRKRSSRARQPAKPVLLSGGNPQIAKGYGDAPVQAYIAAMPGWKRDVGRRLDALIERTVPGVHKAVKWNSPFYGVEDQTAFPKSANRFSEKNARQPGAWFLSFHCFTKYVKVTFFRGTSLDPVPPGPSKHKDVRYLDIHEGELDADQFVAWVKQASRLPGERM